MRFAGYFISLIMINFFKGYPAFGRFPLALILLYTASLLSSGSCKKNNSTPQPVDSSGLAKTFSNPIINGADPWVAQRAGSYYYMHTLGNRLAIWKTDKMSVLREKNPVNVYAPPPGQANSANLWAPELHWLDNAWYIYYTAGAGHDSTQRSWVLENKNEDPTRGTWTDRGRIFSADLDIWAIDGTVFNYQNKRYFIFSGRPVIGIQNQNIYISEMSNPWTLTGPVVKISEPQLSWETNGPVNEGPEILVNPNGDVYLIFSASGCWTDNYTLGYLRLKAGESPMTASNWQKAQQPVFSKNVQGNAFGPGHNSFFKSPDGKEDWIIYHANSSSGDGCGSKRSVRMQKFTWNNDGTPNFGQPVATGQKIAVPSGE